MAKKKHTPKTYAELSKDQKALAHYLVSEGELEGLSKEEQEMVLYKVWLKDHKAATEPLM